MHIYVFEKKLNKIRKIVNLWHYQQMFFKYMEIIVYTFNQKRQLSTRYVCNCTVT